MADEKLAKLVQRLHSATMDQRIKWGKSIKDQVYQVGFPEYTIEISFRPALQEDEGPDYVLRIYNNENTLIEEVDDPDLAANMGQPEAFQMMHAMYRAARRMAEGVDEAIDSILSSLADPNDETEIPF